jgi:hypothetical protein
LNKNKTMTLRTTIISTSRRIDFEIPAEMVGKELEITAIEKVDKKSQSLDHQYKMAASENKELVKEFQAIDLEGWENEY